MKKIILFLFACAIISLSQALPLSGTYTINKDFPTSGTNFNNFTDFASTLIANGINDNVVVDVIKANINNGIYVEQAKFEEFNNLGNFTVTIQGNGNTLQYLSTNQNEPATLKLNGTDHVTINNLIVKADGENPGEYGFAVWLANGADNNTFNNCQFIVTMNSTLDDFIPFATTNYPTNPIGGGDPTASNLTVTNCIAKGGYYGMIITSGENHEIINNQVKDFYSYGLYAIKTTYSMISKNTISRPERTDVSTTYMIYLKGDFTGTHITKNRLIDFAAEIASTTFPASGIYGQAISAEPGHELLLANNVISGFENMNGNQCGIFLWGDNTAGGNPVNIQIYHNSVSLDHTNHPGSGSINGLYFRGYYNSLDIQNNIISYTSNSTGPKYCLNFDESIIYGSITCDYNILHLGTTGNIGRWEGIAYATLVAWQLPPVSLDGSSSDADPMFVNLPPDNLRPSNCNDIGDKGTPLSIVPDDIIGVFRPLDAAPEPGAYEIKIESDLWAQDTPIDVGNEPNHGLEWVSEDIWVRNLPDNIRSHQNPEYTEGSPNYVYVEIRNRGCMPYIANETGQVILYWAKASADLSWETPWTGGVFFPPLNGVLMGEEIGTQVIPTIGPYESHIMQFEWYPPDPETYKVWFPGEQNHFCLLARIITSEYPPYGMTFPELPGYLGGNVINNNNIVWKNIAVVDEDKKKCGFLVGNYSPSPGIKKLVFTVPEDEVSNSIFDIGTVKIKLQPSLYQIWEAGGKQGSNIIESPVDSSIQILSNGAFISNLAIGAESIYGISAEIERDAIPPLPLNDEYNLYVLQKHELNDTIDGGVDFLMNRGFLDPNRYVDVTVILEGPFNGSSMNAALNTQGLIPLNQPYNVEPWNYPGTEVVMSLPANTVDWVLIELRDAPSAAEATSAMMIARQAAFLRSDGKVTDLLGNPELNFGPLTITNDLYVVVYQRNHLSVLSATRLTKSDGVYTRDFTIDSGQAYGSTSAQKEIAPGVWGMIGGDGDADGMVDIPDKDPVWESEAGTQGYIASDYNLDVHSNNQDKDDIWEPNFGAESQVPVGETFTCGSLLFDARNGQSYQTVLIGDQCWMAENLNVGTMINGSISQTNNSTIEKYCYSNNTTNCDIYGGLYQWNEAMQYTLTPGVPGICPTVWHLPTDEEWCTLEQFIEPIIPCDRTWFSGTHAGGDLKETGIIHWYSPNTGATDAFGFTALPGGKRDNGSFDSFPYFAFFWTSNEYDIDWGWCRALYYNYASIRRAGDSKTRGYSVRCLKD